MMLLTRNVIHELGHSLGAHHDDTHGCHRAAADFLMGPYLLYGGALEAKYPYSDSFSDCSKRYIVHNLNSLSSQGRYCLVPDQSPTTAGCGNGVVESGEECDCGEFCSADPCCEMPG